jgi:phosphate-selective porin
MTYGGKPTAILAAGRDIWVVSEGLEALWYQGPLHQRPQTLLRHRDMCIA